MKKIDNFTNVYKVSKTLRFKLIPIGATQENFENAKILERDEERAENYKKAKEIIDKYYNLFITRTLDEVNSKEFVSLLKKFEKLYLKNEKTEEERKELNVELTKKLREEIVKKFKESEIYGILFKKDLINIILEDEKISEEEKTILKSFDKFFTYFSNYFITRQNIFSSEDKVGSVAYRSVNENLPIFIKNIVNFEKAKDKISKEIKNLEQEIGDLSYGCKVSDVFNIDYFGLCLTGESISKYNAIIGGVSEENSKKIQGINEYINLYNQKNKNDKLRFLSPLYKQILQEGEKISFSVDVFEKDEEIFNAVDQILENENYKIEDIHKEIVEAIKNINNFNISKIWVNAKEITFVSNKIYGQYNIIANAFNKKYDEENIKNKNKKSYEDDKKKYFKNINEYSLAEIIDTVKKYNEEINIDFCEELNKIIDVELQNFGVCCDEYKNIDRNKSIKLEQKTIEKIKNLLDSIKNIYDYVKIFDVKSLDIEIDEDFYNVLQNNRKLDSIIKLYNMTRNYITKKPYSLDKIKLNFDNSTLLNGWDVNKETDNSGILLEKDGKYYLGIMSTKSNKIFLDIKNCDDKASCYRKINYKLLPGPNKMLPKVFLSNKGKEVYKPSDYIVKNYDKGRHKKGETFDKNFMYDLIDFFKNGINMHEDYKNFNFKFSETSKYEDLSMFYREVEHQGYKITYINVSEEYINEKINNGELYLYQIYNKDFSSYSHGKKNLHTLYFEQLFDSENLKNVVYKLNGEAEVFYRKKSINYKITHPKNVALENKNEDNVKKTSLFNYDLIKDKRFAFDQIEFHVPITINFKSEDSLYNDQVVQSIKNCKDNYIIGIDRGERNLIYIVVINEKGEIVEQTSLNEIINEYNGQKYTTDYHALLDKKEKERTESRKNWTSVENIKELKEGYVSQVVHKICELVEKYDAIIVMEDLNSGFKNSRIKVEKQVYQKFEKMLIDKLNLYINKNKKADECGGLRKAYQLTRPYEGNLKMAFQNGFIFYVAPWNTSKIDPTTGFVNLFRFGNYTSIDARKTFFSKFDEIKYNKNKNYFEFSFDYSNFDNASYDYNKKWTVCTNGNRILTFRNKEKNSQWDQKNIVLTDEFVKLFEKNNININGDIKNQILELNSKEFFDSLFNLFKLTLQIRNSVSNSNEDYLISSIINKNNKFFNSNDGETKLPKDADANGAYNIARKGAMIVERIKKGVTNRLTVISNQEWLEYAQTHI